MGHIGGMLGLAGGAGGSGFGGPSGVDLTIPATGKQATDAYAANQQALAQQQALVQALQSQQGIANQSDVYNQLKNVAAGTGPNPAQTMLNQATGTNIANQAALMAGQRGASANTGLIARQAAQQGSQIQQQAAGQGATMQANQSLGALQNMGNLATQQVGQQMAATQGLTGAQQGEQQNILNSIAQLNAARAGVQANVNQANAGLASQTMGFGSQIAGGLMSGLSSGLGMMKADGGEVKMYADPNDLVSQDNTVPMNNTIMPMQQAGPKSNFTKFLKGFGQGINNSQQNSLSTGSNALGTAIGSGIKNLFSPATTDVAAQTQMNQDSGKYLAAKGGKVPALVSPGEQYLPPNAVKQVAKGANPLAIGERIPGKPKHPGNDYRNDIVPKTLEEGGVVIPNKIMQSKNASANAAKFVEAILNKQKMRHG